MYPVIKSTLYALPLLFNIRLLLFITYNKYLILLLFLCCVINQRSFTNYKMLQAYNIYSQIPGIKCRDYRYIFYFYKQSLDYHKHSPMQYWFILDTYVVVSQYNIFKLWLEIQVLY